MKNLGLLTKESTNQFKSKWNLFVFFMLFLILSMGIITGLIHFTYSYGHDAKKYDTLDRYTTLNIHGPQNEEGVKKDGDYYKYLINDLSLNSEQADAILKDEGNILPTLKAPIKDKNGVSSDQYMNNAFLMWLYTKGLGSWANSPTADNTLRLNTPDIVDGLYKADKVTISCFQVGKNTNLNNLKKDQTIYDWQRIKNDNLSPITIVKAVKGFSIDSFPINDKNANDVIVTPNFLKTKHLKIGQTIPLLFKNDIFRVRIAATGITPSQVTAGHNDRIAFNPILFNQYTNQEINRSKQKDNFIPELEVLNKTISNYSGTDEINKFYSDQYNYVENIFSSSFTDDAMPDVVSPMTYGMTSIKSYHMEMTIYNLFSWVVTAILIALLIVAYWFIQGLIIRSNKRVLINLKATGVNQGELGYYLGISFLPVLLIGSGIGLALGEFLYWLLTKTLGQSTAIVMSNSPESVLGYVIFICIFIGMIIIGGAMAYSGTRGSKLSIHDKGKFTIFEKMFLGIKSWKIFENSGFSNVIYSFQVSNLLKAFSTFIVTILSLVVLGTSLQFITSIGGTLDKRPFMYQDKGNSLSFREYEDGQIKNTVQPLSSYNILKTKYSLKNNGTYVVPKGTNPYETLAEWMGGFIVDPRNQGKPMYDLYFNQVYSLDDFYQQNNKGKNNSLANEDYQKEASKLIIDFLNKEHYPLTSVEEASIKKNLNGKKIYNYLDSFDRAILTYKTNFGKKAVEPKVFFKNRPSDKNFIDYQEMHDGEIVANQAPIKLFDSNKSKYDDLKWNEVVINNFVARRYDIQVGDTMRIKFNDIAIIHMDGSSNEDSDINHVYNNNAEPIDFTVKAIDDTLYNMNEGIMNFNQIREVKHNYEQMTSGDYRNGVVSKSSVPYDMEYLTIPVGIPELAVGHDPGSQIWDYFPDSFNTTLITNFDFSSLPVIKSYYMAKTYVFRSFATIISAFLAIVSLAIVCVISILIAYENKENVLVMKTLGYSTKRTLSIFATIYTIMIAIGFVASIFISGAILDSFTQTLASRLGLALTHMYNAETILVPFAIAFVFCTTIAAEIIHTYRKTSVDEITFAE